MRDYADFFLIHNSWTACNIQMYLHPAVFFIACLFCESMYAWLVWTWNYLLLLCIFIVCFVTNAPNQYLGSLAWLRRHFIWLAANTQLLRCPFLKQTQIHNGCIVLIIHHTQTRNCYTRPYFLEREYLCVFGLRNFAFILGVGYFFGEFTFNLASISSQSWSGTSSLMTRVTPVYSPPGSNLMPMLVETIVVVNKDTTDKTLITIVTPFSLSFITLPLPEVWTKKEDTSHKSFGKCLLLKIPAFPIGALGSAAQLSLPPSPPTVRRRLTLKSPGPAQPVAARYPFLLLRWSSQILPQSLFPFQWY